MNSSLMRGMAGLLLAAALVLPAGCSDSTGGSTDTPPTSPTASIKTPDDSQGRLWISMPEMEAEAVLVSVDETEEGKREDQYLYESAIHITCERMRPRGNGIEAAVDYTMQEEGIAADDIDAQEDENATQRLTYPVYRLAYTTGSNEDTSWNMDMYIQTDGWDLRVHVRIPIDMEEDYAEQVVRWFSSAELFEDEANVSEDIEVGGDWRVWRSYTEEYKISDEYSVMLSLLDDYNGFAVYNAETGARDGNLMFPEGAVIDDDWTDGTWGKEFLTEDRNGDGNNDLGVVANDGSVYWYAFSPDAPSWYDDPTKGYFVYIGEGD